MMVWTPEHAEHGDLEGDPVLAMMTWTWRLEHDDLQA